jgi:hypothetical protein
MPSPNYKRLSNKIKEPAFAGKTDAEIATLLNTKGSPVPGVVEPSALLRWGAASGVRAKIEDVAGTLNHPLRSVCLAVRDQLSTGVIGLSVGSPDVVAMLDGLVAATVMTAQQKADVIALGSTPAPSWSDAEWGSPVTTADITIARGF